MNKKPKSFYVLLQKATADFKIAEMIISSNDQSLFENAAFHLQQAAEKWLKTFLISHNISYPKTHDLSELFNLAIPLDQTLDKFLDLSDSLSPHAVVSRYEEGLELSQEDIHEIFATTNAFKNYIQAKLI